MNDRRESANPPGRHARGGAFAMLYLIESCTRALMASVVPILAYDLLHSEQRVSMLYTAVSLFGLALTLLIPVLTAVLPRRWVYTIGALALATSSLLFAAGLLPTQIVAMALRTFGASVMAITLNLYILDHVRRSDMVAVEARKMGWATIAWTLGPAGGVWLYDRFGIVAPALVSFVFAVIVLAVFWWYRLGQNPLIRPGKARAGNPLANIRRFVAQPRMRLAWAIAFGRSCFWTTFYVYAPILMVVSGQGNLAGGLVVSAGNLMLLLSVPWGRVGARFGVRSTIAGGFAAIVVLLLAASVTAVDYPLVTAALLLGGSLFAVAHDAVGSAPFLRAVRPFERGEMTAVYRTYLELSDLLPSIVYSVVLIFFGIGSVFFTLAILIAVIGWLSWVWLPESM